jgi:hypothetical protein
MGDICLDVINRQNSIKLRLNTEFLANCPEKPTHNLDTLEKQNLWRQFIRESQIVYDLLGNQPFWLTNKVDKRGRLYAQCYHVTTQGTAYKKAMIELADKEYVNGVPE